MIPGLERQEGGSELRVTLTTQLVLTTPSYRKPCFVWGFVVVVFMSLVRSLVYFTTTKQLEKWKFVFKECQSCFLCQLSPFILHPLAQCDLWGRGRRHRLHFLSNLPLYSGLLVQCIYRHLPHRQYDPKLDVWYSDTPVRKQLLLLAPDPSTLDILVSSVWPPPIQDLPMIQRSRKLLGHCHSLMASFQHN